MIPSATLHSELARGKPGKPSSMWGPPDGAAAWRCAFTHRRAHAQPHRATHQVSSAAGWTFIFHPQHPIIMSVNVSFIDRKDRKLYWHHSEHHPKRTVDIKSSNVPLLWWSAREVLPKKRGLIPTPRPETTYVGRAGAVCCQLASSPASPQARNS